MRKILVVHNLLWTHYKSSVFSELNKIAKKNKYDFVVLQIAYKGLGQNKFGDVDYSLIKYPYKLLFNDFFENINIFKMTTVLLREIHSYKPDIIVQAGFSHFAFWASLIYARLFNIPSILTCDSTLLDNPKSFYKTFLKKIYVRNCDAAFSYGIKSREYLVSLGMNPKNIAIRCQASSNSKIRQIYDFAMKSRLEKLRDLNLKPKNFIYVGRLVEIKNLVNLFKAFSSLKQNSNLATNWGLLIAGDGPQKNELTKLISDLNLEDVFFLGGKDWKQVPEVLALSNVLVLPSYSEPWGLVVNEAMICSLPVLVSDRCGSAFDLVSEGLNGYTFDPYNQSQIIDKLSFFVNNDKKLIRMGEESRKIISKYTPQNAAQVMFKTIDTFFN